MCWHRRNRKKVSVILLALALAWTSFQGKGYTAAPTDNSPPSGAVSVNDAADSTSSTRVTLEFPKPPGGLELIRLLNKGAKPDRNLPATVKNYISVFGNKVVFTDSTDGNTDVFLYDFASGEVSRLTQNRVNQISPRIYGNYIAWLDYRSGIADLYLYDLNNGRKRHVDRLFYNKTETVKSWFAFDLNEKYLVYSKKVAKNMDLYLFDLSSGMRYRLTKGGYNILPRLHNDNVVYINREGRQNRIFLANVTTKKVKQISPLNGNFGRPDIYGENVVFSEEANVADPGQEGRLYIYSIAKGASEVVPEIYNTKDPLIYEDRIVWADRSTDDLKEYNLKTQKTKTLTSHGSQKNAFDLQGKRLVWADNYPGQWGIYSLLFDDLIPGLTVTEPADNLKTNNSLLAVAGFAEAGSTVKINGKKIETSPDGNFNRMIELSTGKNEIAVTATDAAGNTATVNRTVYYSDDKVFGLEVGPDPLILGSGMAYVKYNLAQKGYVTVKVFDKKDSLVRTVASGLLQKAGVAFQSWNGKDNSGSLVDDGKYKFVVEARNEAGRIIGRAEKELTASRFPNISNVTGTPDPFNPAEGQAVIRYTVSSDALVTVNIMSGAVPVRSLVYNELKREGDHSVSWDGRDNNGKSVVDGGYNYQIQAVSQTVYNFKHYYRGSITVESQNPVITDLMVNPDPVNLSAGTGIWYRLSENAKITLKIVNNSGNAVRTLLNGAAGKAGFNSVSWDGKDGSGKNLPEGTYKVEVTATDNYGKPSQPVNRSFKAGYIPLITNTTVKPNPFKPGGKKSQAVISFNISNDALVTVEIFTESRYVNTIVAGQKESGGVKAFTWNGKSSKGKLAGPGTYYYRITAVSLTVPYFKSICSGSFTVK